MRLVLLLPGEGTADIRVCLIHTNLTSGDVPKFEALSYAWGERDTSDHIYVGQTGDNTLAVTQNLRQALPYLRHRDKRRVLWIDAICVNQQNLKERGLQVERMADIYSLASQVVVWIGPENDITVQAIGLLRSIASKIEVDWVTSKMTPVLEEDIEWADLAKAMPCTQQDVFAIYVLIMRPWFERLWVQQEIRANHNATIMCGLGTLPWFEFRKAMFCFRAKCRYIGDEIRFPGFQDRIDIISFIISEGSYLGLGELIDRSKQCECSDPKDRVYAVLNMLDKHERGAGIKPDYTKTVGQVYKDAVLSILKHANKVNILEYCGMQVQPSGGFNPLQLPSWVPDWSVPNSIVPIYTGYASGNSDAEISFEEDMLRVTGTLVAKINQVLNLTVDNTAELISAIQDFAQKHLPDLVATPYITGGSQLDAYCRALCANHFLGQYVPPQALMPDFQQSRALLLSILNSQQTMQEIFSTILGGHRHFFDHVWQYCTERSIFTTEQGYIGLAPRAANPGDCISVLLGSDLPLVLRSKENNQYQVLGPCYIQGFMTGEALLGPLPDNQSSVIVFNSKRNRYTRAFQDSGTRKLQWNDPRLQSEAVREPAEDEPEWGRQERETLTSEALRKRGVNMEIFELV